MNTNDTRLTLSEVQGPFIDLLEKIGGRDGELWLRGLNKFLRKENPWEKPESFKIVEVGTYKDVKSLRKALEESGVQIGDWAGDILNKTKLSKSKQSLDLVVLSVKELGFPQGTQLKDIYEAAKNQGLDLCPAEVGPQLRLQYPDQPNGEWLVIAMEPIKDSGGALGLFRVGCGGGGLWLNAYNGNPDNFWNGNNRFVFVRR
ncbi:hypothetical protein GYA37_03190 [candidate division WWE3 bacterium]|uniref:Uncharacterized protein n=1 Tax=candidate division WWE3 bacterium TaxID=2053526 RepID=A0A7X9E7A5_UNCKA|nr:hypothetical protein [candidate division WWE3 bacterium]